MRHQEHAHPIAPKLTPAAFRQLIAKKSPLIGHTFVLEYFDEATLEECEPRLSEGLQEGSLALIGDQIYFLYANHADRWASDPDLQAVIAAQNEAQSLLSSR